MQRFIFCFLFITFFQSCFSQNLFTLQRNLTRSTGINFGQVVVANANYLMVGSPGENINSGAVYVYFINAGSYSIQNTFKGTAAFAYFGSMLSIYGTNFVVGAYGDANFRGSVYVYSLSSSTWSLSQILTASDGEPRDHFGFSVAVSGSWMAVGANKKEGSNGVVYIFQNNGTFWNQQAEIFSPYANSSEFGYSLALFKSNILAVGAPYTGSGQVGIYILSGNNWILQQNLTNDAVVDAEFGYHIASDGTSIAVVAYQDAVGNQTFVGSVFVYSNNGTQFNLQNKLYPTSYSSYYDIGDSISIFRDTVIVGCLSQESIYSFHFNGYSWSQSQILMSDDYTNSIDFGISAFLDVDTLYVGDDLYRNADGSFGIVYVFTRSQVTTAMQTTQQQTTQQQTTAVQTSAMQTTLFKTTELQTTETRTTRSNTVSSGVMNIPSFFFFALLILLLLK